MSYCLCRLQPSAVVTDEQCAACDFNKPGKTCLRSMEWVWRGEHYSATSAEYNSIKAQLTSESFPPAVAGGPVRSAALPCGLSSPHFHLFYPHFHLRSPRLPSDFSVQPSCICLNRTSLCCSPSLWPVLPMSSTK